MTYRVMRLAQKMEREGKLGLERRYYQHGATTVYRHSVQVAVLSCMIAQRLRLKVDYHALMRGALLHDYFLYDWHVKEEGRRLHGFFHPGVALKNAKRDYRLTPREENIIRCHMFPLVPLPPNTKEGWIVCFADKVCALRETLQRTKRHRTNR